jgi:hypothetical protein
MLILIIMIVIYIIMYGTIMGNAENFYGEDAMDEKQDTCETSCIIGMNTQQRPLLWEYVVVVDNGDVMGIYGKYNGKM